MSPVRKKNPRTEEKREISFLFWGQKSISPRRVGRPENISVTAQIGGDKLCDSAVWRKRREFWKEQQCRVVSIFWGGRGGGLERQQGR